MSNPHGTHLQRDGLLARNPESPHPRAVGSPLPRGSMRRAAPPPVEPDGEAKSFTPPGRALAGTSAPIDSDYSAASNVQRALHALRSAVPYVQRLLPLLDGNVVSTVANLLTPHPRKPSAPVSLAPVNLAPLEDSLTTLEMQNRELHDRVLEQNSSIKHVEDRLEMVREATDRNTLEQQELMEDLKNVGTKVNLIALVALSLLTISVLLNLVLYLHIQRVLP